MYLIELDNTKNTYSRKKRHTILQNNEFAQDQVLRLIPLIFSDATQMIVWSTESNALSEIVKNLTTSGVTIKNLACVWTECLQRHEVSIVR